MNLNAKSPTRKSMIIFTHIVEIERDSEINIFSMENGFWGHPVGLNIEEMEAFLEKMKEMRGAEND